MIMQAVHRHRHAAMATLFELRIVCSDARYAEQAATECFRQLDALESLLNRHDENSEISRLGRLETGGSLRLASETFACLRIALEAHALTAGAFDPMLGAQLDALRGKGSDEAPAERGGMLELDPLCLEARVIRAPVRLDLGAIGKGFALDRMSETLLEWDLHRALLVAGEGSSILALDGPAKGAAWEVCISEGPARRIMELERHALGASGPAVQGAHILDPFRRSAVTGRRAWALAPTAALADALSTAAMILEPEELEELCAAHPNLGMAISAAEPCASLNSFGALRKEASTPGSL